MAERAGIGQELKDGVVYDVLQIKVGPQGIRVPLFTVVCNLMSEKWPDARVRNGDGCYEVLLEAQRTDDLAEGL